MLEIDVVAAEAALGEHGGDLGRRTRGAFAGGVDHHAGEARRQRQRVERLALRGDAAVAVDRAEVGKQALRLGERRGRRRIEKHQLAGIGDAPLREVEHQGREVGGEDFRLAVRRERRGLRLVPQPVADAGLDPAGAAAPLVGRRARHPYRFETGEADIRLVAGHPGDAGVDHHAHAVDGDRGLRDRGRQHDLAVPRGRRRNRFVLDAGIERAEERIDADRGIGDGFAQPRLGAADFRGARQEREDRAGIGPQRARDRVRDLRLDGLCRVAADVAGLDRKCPALARDHRGVAQRLGDPRAVDGCGHHKNAQVFTQALLGIAGERKAEIGIERALMELVEQHGGDAVEAGVVENEAGEHALGDDLDAGAARDL